MADILLLKLDCYNLILGTQWLSNLGDVIWNFKELRERLKLINESKMCKLLKKDQILLLHVCSTRGYQLARYKDTS